MIHEGLQHGRRLERCCVYRGHNKLAQLLCTQLHHLQRSSKVRDQQHRGCIAFGSLETPLICMHSASAITESGDKAPNPA